jgi:5-dehydro-2-deoxygluconokinase
VLLGLEAPEDELAKGFKAVAAKRHVKGFAVGRTIFNDAARAWLAGQIDDTAAIDMAAEKFVSASCASGKKRAAPGRHMS